MEFSEELRKYNGDGEVSKQDGVMSEIFSAVDREEAIEAVLSEIEMRIAKTDEDLLLAVSELTHREAYLEALVERLAELIDGYDEPADLIESARTMIERARSTLREAREKHGELMSMVRRVLQERDARALEGGGNEKSGDHKG